MTLLTAVAAMGGLTAVLASVLIAASRAFHVDEDPRIEAVEELLPHANCGACGYPGCRPFAEALVAGHAQPGRCTVSSESERQAVADFLGVEVGAAVKLVARLACAGGTNVARDRARYEGEPTCAAAAVVAGGAKACSWGCLGFADCELSCDFDAITMNAHALPVVDEELCTACGDCVAACPKLLFSLVPADRRIWVACRSQEAGDEILEDCEVACTACGRCAADAPELIHMEGALPVVDTGRPHESKTAIQRCPTGAIVWLDPQAGPQRGAAAKPVLRKAARRAGAT